MITAPASRISYGVGTAIEALHSSTDGARIWRNTAPGRPVARLDYFGMPIVLRSILVTLGEPLGEVFTDQSTQLPGEGKFCGTLRCFSSL